MEDHFKGLAQTLEEIKIAEELREYASKTAQRHLNAIAEAIKDDPDTQEIAISSFYWDLDLNIPTQWIADAFHIHRSRISLIAGSMTTEIACQKCGKQFIVAK